MKRALIFARRNFTEMLRDPLCYVFCLILPICLMLTLHLVFGKDAFWFDLNILTPGINCFGYAFSMLYLCLMISQDRSTAFLMRLYTSPMKPGEFFIGYSLPGIAIGAMQGILCYITAAVVGLAQYGTVGFSFGPALLALVCSLPVLLAYCAIGVIFGSLFSDKSAPGLCSAIITVSAFLSGAWMLVDESTGFGKVCHFLPFYPTVKFCRFALAGFQDLTVNQNITKAGLEKITETASFSTCTVNLLISLLWAAVLIPLAVFTFSRATHRDNG